MHECDPWDGVRNRLVERLLTQLKGFNRDQESAGTDDRLGRERAVATAVVESFCFPGQPREIRHVVAMRPGGGADAKSRKVSNVLLDVRKLMAAAASGALGAVAVATNPWTAPLFGLVLWDAVFSRCEKEISERDASVLWAMWVNQEGMLVTPGNLVSMVNKERVIYGKQVLSVAECDESLDTLQRLGCIAKEATVDGEVWRLRERVTVTF